MKKLSFSFSLRSYIGVLGLFAMCIAPIVYKELLSDATSFMRIMSSCLYLLPVCLFITSIRNKWLYAIATVLLMVTSFMETMMVLLYNNYLVAGNLLSIVNTTIEEGGGFVMTALGKVPFAIIILLFGIISLRYKCKCVKFKICFISVLFSLLLAIAFLVYQLAYRWEGNITTRFYVEQNVLSRPPYNFLYQTFNAVQQQRQRSFIAEAEKMTFYAKRPNIKGKEIYAILVGESLRYDNLSLGGYNRKTTPLLETLDNVTLFSDYYSTANLTMYSVPQILTRATPDDFLLNYKERSIMKPFLECGFKCYTICAGNLLSSEKHLSCGCDSLFSLSESEDDKIASIVDSLANIHEKLFFMIQFKGNHGPYNNFTKTQDVYHPNPVFDKVSWDNHDALINAYDNTVLFTDYNVYNIINAINKLDSQSALLMVSDHGADYDTGVSDHGGNCNPRKAEYHVPLIFWHNETWSEFHPAKKVNMLKHKDRSVNADNVFYSVCDMADISIGKEYAKIEWSIFSDKYTEHQRKLLVPDGKNSIVVE